jgi:recombination associated protein RdgC
MFKNAIVFKLEQPIALSINEVRDRMRIAAFLECAPTQAKAVGWVPPRGAENGELLEMVGNELIAELCVETKAVPSKVVKRELDKALDKIEADTGRRPKGKKAKELKEDIVHGLLPRAFPKRSTTKIWIASHSNLVVVGAGSEKAADDAITLLVDAVGPGAQVRRVNTATAPVTAMSEWLTSKEAPPEFTIDRECELKQPDSEKSAVRYSRHTLDIEEVGEHISQGKLPTQLAMTWNSRVSFVLTEGMALRKIQMLDVALEGREDSGADGFDADVAITTGELGQMVPTLLLSLGGLLEPAAA